MTYDSRRFDSVGWCDMTISIFAFMNLIGPFKFSSLADRKGVKMRANKIICFAVGAMLAARAACADKITIASNILGPEGPLYVDGNLYYVGWVSNTLSKWDGKTATVLNHTPGCGHNGLALTKRKTFLLACTEEHGAILELDMTGKQLRRWDADKNGKPFDGGINDIVVTANGGAYATVFGPYKDLPTSVAGKILYLAPGSEKWHNQRGNERTRERIIRDSGEGSKGPAGKGEHRKDRKCEVTGSCLWRTTPIAAIADIARGFMGTIPDMIVTMDDVSRDSDG